MPRLHRLTDCETQRAITKAGAADCGIVTVQTYRELIRGLFDKDMGINVEHTKNLNQGDDCCEVVVKKLQKLPSERAPDI